MKAVDSGSGAYRDGDVKFVLLDCLRSITSVDPPTYDLFPMIEL